MSAGIRNTIISFTGRFTLLIILGLCFPILLFGQAIIGVKGGYNFSVPLTGSNGNPHHDADLSVSQNSYLLSAFYKSRIPDKLVNMGFEAEYFKTGLSGYQVDGGLGAGTIYDYDFTLHFLNLIVKPQFVFGSSFKFIINTGAYLGFIIKAKTTGNYSTYGPFPPTSGQIDENTNLHFNTVNLGFLGGIGAEYPVSERFVINVEADFLVGITHLANSSLSDAFFNLFNTQISAGLAYKINRTGNPDKEKKKIDWYEN
jgi:hypothetical protein